MKSLDQTSSEAAPRVIRRRGIVGAVATAPGNEKP